MIVGIPKEVKEDENRVALTPGGAAELIKAGHTVLIERGAGEGSRISDKQFSAVGASLVDEAAEVYGAELVVKVKEPIEPEYQYLRAGQVLFCFLHLAANKPLAGALIESGCVALGYETVADAKGRLPLLAPMSEIAGRLAAQEGARFLEAHNGGRGVLLGGVAGVLPAKVGVIGGGIVGSNAALIALGMGAQVTIVDINLDRLRYLEEIMTGNIRTLMANTLNIAQVVAESDLAIGAVLSPGARAPSVVSEAVIKAMKPGSVVVDVAIDQGGCVETVVPTTHSNPVRIVHDVLHYGVTNIPGAVPHTSTHALTNSTLPWIIELAGSGWRAAADDHPEIATGLNVVAGKITHAVVAEALG